MIWRQRVRELCRALPHKQQGGGRGLSFTEPLTYARLDAGLPSD